MLLIAGIVGTPFSAYDNIVDSGSLASSMTHRNITHESYSRTRPFVFMLIPNDNWSQAKLLLSDLLKVDIHIMDTDVVIIGGGVCGVLAGRRFAKEGFTYKIIEKAADFGGVWHYRANDYSHLQVNGRLCTHAVSATHMPL